MTEEQYLYEHLNRLKEQYYKDAEPYMKRLAALRSFQLRPVHMYVDWDAGRIHPLAIDTAEHGITGEKNEAA